ncbi:MAG: glycosyltransferase family 2 protein [Patescibacteria group bacterium]
MAREENNLSNEGVSIIIPCLNEERYIGTVLSCITQQSFQNFEVIVVDGFSRDHTKQAVENTTAAHPELANKLRFVLAPNKGVAAQRNYGVSVARFERIVFFDADVQMSAAYLAHTLKEVSKHNLDLATTTFAPASKRLDDKIVYAICNLYLYIKQFVRPSAIGFCIFSTKTAHQAVQGFNEALNLGEDMDYVDRASKEGFSFKILKSNDFYASVRRLDKEGRFNYYKKGMKAEILTYLKDQKSVSDSIEYRFGHYDE